MRLSLPRDQSRAFQRHSTDSPPLDGILTSFLASAPMRSTSKPFAAAHRSPKGVSSPAVASAHRVPRFRRPDQRPEPSSAAIVSRIENNGDRTKPRIECAPRDRFPEWQQTRITGRRSILGYRHGQMRRNQTDELPFAAIIRRFISRSDQWRKGSKYLPAISEVTQLCRNSIAGTSVTRISDGRKSKLLAEKIDREGLPSQVSTDFEFGA